MTHTFATDPTTRGNKSMDHTRCQRRRTPPCSTDMVMSTCHFWSKKYRGQLSFFSRCPDLERFNIISSDGFEVYLFCQDIKKKKTKYSNKSKGAESRHCSDGNSSSVFACSKGNCCFDPMIYPNPMTYSGGECRVHIGAHQRGR